MQPHTIVAYGTEPRALDLHAGGSAQHRLWARTCCCAPRARAASAHATNIAETMHYLLTGDLLSADRPNADGSGGVDASWGHT